MCKLVPAADDERVECVARIQLCGAFPIEARLGRTCRHHPRRKPAIMAQRSGCRIIFGCDELHLFEFETQVIDNFLDEIGVLVADLTKFRGGHTHKQNSPAGMTVASWLQPCVVGMPVDLLLERIQDAQPRISGKCRTRNGHKKYSWSCGQNSAGINSF